MIIRKAVIGEEPLILSFYEDLIRLMKDEKYLYPPRWVIGVYPREEDITEAVRTGEYYIAVEDERIVGAFILNHTEGEGYDRTAWHVQTKRPAVIHLLAVHPELQGRGLAKALLKKAVEISRHKGDASIRLDTLPWNKQSCSLYSHFGFQHCGDVELEYPSTGTILFSMFEYKL